MFAGKKIKAVLLINVLFFFISILIPIISILWIPFFNWKLTLPIAWFVLIFFYPLSIFSILSVFLIFFYSYPFYILIKTSRVG